MRDEPFDVCPTDVVHAPVERVWPLLIEPSRLHWVDAKLVSAPARALAVGDRLLFRAGPGLRVSWSVVAVEPEHSLTLDIALPFGVTNHETVVLTRIDDASCRVTFN
jgi:hypothetical protein